MLAGYSGYSGSCAYHGNQQTLGIPDIPDFPDSGQTMAITEPHGFRIFRFWTSYGNHRTLGIQDNPDLPDPGQAMALAKRL